MPVMPGMPGVDAETVALGLTLAAMVLSSAEVIDAVQHLEGVTLPLRTLAGWARQQIVEPSVLWVRRRGRYHGRRYSLEDLARVRLVVHLRQAGVSMQKIRTMLAYLDTELRDVFKPGSRATLVVDGTRAYLQRPGQMDVEIPSGQLRLKLGDVFSGIREAARNAQRAA